LRFATIKKESSPTKRGADAGAIVDRPRLKYLTHPRQTKRQARPNSPIPHFCRETHQPEKRSGNSSSKRKEKAIKPIAKRNILFRG